jgi:hypothetical protein
VALAAVLAAALCLRGSGLPGVAQAQSTASEIHLGVQLSGFIESHYRVVADAAETARLQRIGDALTAAAERQDLQYHFRILVLTEVNAFSLPGGWVYVTEGLTRFARSDDELAAAVAFEMAHIDHRDYYKVASHMGGAPVSIALASSLLAGSPVGDVERAADLGAVDYLAKTSYSPVAMLTLMEHLAQATRFVGELLAGFGPRPLPADRVAYIRDDLMRLHIPIVRRPVEGYLRIALDPPQPAAGNPVTIRVDGQPIVTLGATADGAAPAARAAALAATLDKFFNQDPQPYDVRAVGIGGRWSVVGGQMELFAVTPQDATFAQSTPQALADTMRIRLAAAIAAAPYVRKF